MKVKGHEVTRDLATGLRNLERDRLVALDLETSGLSPFGDRIALVQLYGDESGTAMCWQPPDGVLPQDLIDYLSDPTRKFVAHNGVAFDMIFLWNAGVDILHGASWFDTLVAETLITPMGRRDLRKTLQASVKRRLGIEISKELQRTRWDDPNLTAEQIEYAVSDTLELPALMRAQVEKAAEHGEERAMAMEMELVPLVAQMTINGLPLSKLKMRKFLKRQSELMDATVPKIEAVFGEINLNSWQQVKAAFAEHLNWALPNTQRITFEALAGRQDPVGEMARLILDIKGPAQMLKMYGAQHKKGMSGSWIDRHIHDGRIHPRFWQCGTDTLRFSSSDPNLQQWPNKERHLIGGDGWMVKTDYAQIEVRVAATLSGDRAMLDILDSAGDIHVSIAAVIFQVPESGVTKQMRQDGKAFTFTLLFGGGAYRVWEVARERGSNISLDEVEEATTAFFEKFEGIHRMRRQARELAKRPGPAVVTLPNGARRILVGRNKNLRTLINTTVQGSAAVGLKMGMLEAGRQGLFAHIGGQVHDELVAHLPDDSEETANQFASALEEALVKGMNQVLPTVPVVAESEVERTWV